jgi:flagellar hook-associated protein 3 FlgL
MRVTNFSISDSAVLNLSTLRGQVDAAQQQISSGKRFTEASVDPAAAHGVMQNQSQLRAVNVGLATSRATLEESALNQLSDILTRARELGIAQATGTASASTRSAAGTEINQLLAQAVNLGNSKDGADYLFGGTTSSTAPYTVDTTGAAATFTVSGQPTGVRAIQIGSGQQLTPTHDGTTVFGTSSAGPLKTLQDMAAALASNDVPRLQSLIGDANAAFDKVQSQLGEVGARASQLQLADSNLTSLSQQLQASTSTLQDVDVEAAITMLTSRQTAYQAAMAATSRILNLSLTDYLK